MMHTNLYRCFNYLNLLSVFFLTSLFLMSSCRITKEGAYLQTLSKDTSLTTVLNPLLETKIKAGDQLSIMVTSFSPAEDEQFNKAAAVSNSPGLSGFTVYPDGMVLLHRLGRISVAGLTRRELAAKLEKDLLAYMRDPIVNVGYMNRKVTIIGAVGKPQVLDMPEEQLPIFDVLLKSGDISENGMKDRVMIIRENGNEKKVKFIDLTDHAIFNSPWYYVQPNDIIVVKADMEKMQKEEKRNKFQSNFTFGTSILALIITVYTLVTR